MGTFFKISVVLTVFLGLIVACQSETSRKVQNIETFARLYGYTRWFHPSDEAQEIDWNKFAVLGVQKVENIKSSEELRDTLYQLFSPVVQGLQIYETRKPEVFNSDFLLSPDPDAKLVAWQHYGVYLNDERFNIYASVRTNRSRLNINSDAAVMCKVLMNSTLQGKKVKLSAFAKSHSQNKEGAKLFVQYILQNDNKIHDVLIESQRLEKIRTYSNNTGECRYGSLWIVDHR